MPARTVRRLPLLLAVAVSAPLLLGACGSSTNTATTAGNLPSATSPPGTGGSSGTNDTIGIDDDTTTTTDAERTTTTKRRTTTTSSDERTTTTKKPKAPVTTGVVSDPSYAQFCAVYVKYENQFDDADLSDEEAFLAQLKQAYQELTNAAPPELQADITKVNAFIQSATSFSDFESAPQDIQDTGDKVEDIAKERCGIT